MKKKSLSTLLATLLFSITSLSLFAQEGQPQAQQSFSDWLNELRAEALNEGITASTLDIALPFIEEPIPRVLELDQSQPEFVQTFHGYMNNRMSQARIERGQALLVEHRELFAEIQAKYGVPPHYLVSFWALESNFGDYTGGFSVLNALATLAYDPRRSSFFRSELLTALKIIDQGHIEAAAMTGSWAGAMGQCQFMPSTFDNYAVDGDGDGKIDIWNSLPDIFASAANFLSRSGWQSDERWGREILLPDDFDYTQSGTGVRKSVSEWNALGLQRANGQPLGQSDINGSVILPAGANGPVFLGYNNFRTTMVWNRSIFYAISVGHLADRFAGGPDIMNMGSETRALSRTEVIEMQGILNGLGFDTGSPDGILGSRTRTAVRSFQETSNLATDGFASFELLTLLRVMSLSE